MRKQINKAKVVFHLIGLIFVLTSSYGQELEVDHLWIHIQSESNTIQIVEEAGLKFSNSIQGNPKMIHKGQGTAGLYVRFKNIYLEFIWIENDSLVQAVAPELGSTLLGFPNTSPIGIGLSFTGEEPVNLPFPTSSYWSEWMRPFDAMAVAKREVSTDPAIWVIPNWLDWRKRTKNKPELLEDAKHTIPVHNVIKIRVYGPGQPSQSEPVQFLKDNNLVEFQSADEHLLELVFDSHFRPTS